MNTQILNGKNMANWTGTKNAAATRCILSFEIKRVFKVHGVCHSPNTLPTMFMVHDQPFRIIIWQSHFPFERAAHIRQLGQPCGMSTENRQQYPGHSIKKVCSKSMDIKRLWYVPDWHVDAYNIRVCDNVCQWLAPNQWVIWTTPFPPPTKDPDDINETLLNAVLNIHKIKFVTYHRFATRVKRRLPLVEQELPTLPGHPMRSRRFSVGLLLFNLFFSV
jgi:hypothetical protein